MSAVEKKGTKEGNQGPEKKDIHASPCIPMHPWTSSATRATSCALKASLRRKKKAREKRVKGQLGLASPMLGSNNSVLFVGEHRRKLYALPSQRRDAVFWDLFFGRLSSSQAVSEECSLSLYFALSLSLSLSLSTG